MKHLMMLFLVFCSVIGSAQETTTKEDSISIIYEAVTRGSSYNCLLVHDHISIKSSGLDTFLRTGAIGKEHWQEAMMLLQAIPLQSIGDLGTPSSKSETDRARVATLIVKLPHKTYESAPFDEGDPPTELKPLIDKILALAETVE